MKDTTTKAVKFVEKALKLLPEDHRDHDYFVRFLGAYDNAEKIADNDEKAAILYSTAIRVSHQLASILFRLNLLTDEVEKEYREFPLPEDADEEYHNVASGRLKVAEDLRAKLNEAQDEQAEIDVFIQVVNGKTEEEAREKLNEYKAQAAMRK